MNNLCLVIKSNKALKNPICDSTIKNDYSLPLPTPKWENMVKENIPLLAKCIYINGQSISPQTFSSSCLLLWYSLNPVLHILLGRFEDYLTLNYRHLYSINFLRTDGRNLKLWCICKIRNPIISSCLATLYCGYFI